MRKVGFFALLTALASLGANADTVVTSKTYVDATRQAKITPATTGTVATYNGTDSNGGAIFSSKNVYSDTTASNYVDSTHSSYLPTMGAVMAQINGATASVLPSGSANQMLQHNGTSWTAVSVDTTPTANHNQPVTSGGVKTYVDSAVATKQDQIPANNFTVDGMSFPGLVATTDSAGTVGEVGIYSLTAVANGDSGAIANFVELSGASDSAELARMDSMVPSLALFGILEGYLGKKQDKQIGLTPVGNANSIDAGRVLVVGNDGKIAMGAAPDTTPTDSSNSLVTSGGVYDSLAGKQDNLGGSGNGGKVVTATNTAGTVTYTTIDSVPTSASNNLVKSGGVKTYVDSKVSTSSSISNVSTTTAPNEKAVYDSINAVQSAVTALQNCTHTCANSDCTLIDVDCVNAFNS